MLDALPDYLDLDPAMSNLSAYEDFATLDDVGDFRADWGESVAVAVLAGLYGYSSSDGNLFHTLLWGLAGYVVPLGTAGYALIHGDSRR